MSRTTILFEHDRNPQLALSDEVLMRLEASELLNIVREKRTAAENFEKITSLIQDQGCTTNNKFHKYFLNKTFNNFVSETPDEGKTAEPRLRKAFDEPIRRTFAKAKLNPEDPFHWHILTMVLCWSIFPPELGRSRLPTWTGTRYCQLLRDASQNIERRRISKYPGN
jgi:hypothetical protein